MNERIQAELTSLDPDTRRYTEELVSRLRQTLGAKLVGVYLHGSAALGDFTLTRSDVDVIAVTSTELSDQERNRLGEELSPAALPCPATGLEFHVVAANTLAHVTDAPPFEVHFATESREGTERLVDGQGRTGDPDLVMHYAVLRTHGVTLSGPDVSRVFPNVPRDLLLRALREELRWASERGSPSYQLLNAARALRFLDEGLICSKSEGGLWARAALPDPAVMDAALAHRRGVSESHPDASAAEAFVHGVAERLDRAIDAGPSES